MNGIFGVSLTGHRHNRLSPKLWPRGECQYIIMLDLICVYLRMASMFYGSWINLRDFVYFSLKFIKERIQFCFLTIHRWHMRGVPDTPQTLPTSSETVTTWGMPVCKHVRSFLCLLKDCLNVLMELRLIFLEKINISCSHWESKHDSSQINQAA
jgi:hypothetical protein